MSGDSRVPGVVRVVAVLLVRELVLLLVLLPPGEAGARGHEGEVDPELLEQVLPAETRSIREVMWTQVFMALYE